MLAIRGSPVLGASKTKCPLEVPRASLMRAQEPRVQVPRAAQLAGRAPPLQRANAFDDDQPAYTEDHEHGKHAPPPRLHQQRQLTHPPHCSGVADGSKTQ
jgi:hypothetical protein